KAGRIWMMPSLYKRYARNAAIDRSARTSGGFSNTHGPLKSSLFESNREHRRMPSRSALLSNYHFLRTNDPELALDRFDALGMESIETARSARPFGVHVNHLQLTNLGLSYCAYDSEVALGFREASFVRQIFNIDG